MVDGWISWSDTASTITTSSCSSKQPPLHGACSLPVQLAG